MMDNIGISYFAETNRFKLREIHYKDEDGMFELDSDPEVHTYLGNNPVVDKEQIRETINSIRRQYIDNGIGRWAIIDKISGEFVGWCGLKLITEPINNHINYYDLGYRILKKYWRMGIASETATATLNYAFQNLDTNVVYAIADCKNIGSNKILTNLGMNFIEKFDLEGIEHNWYKMDRFDFERKYKINGTQS